jgi:hypothetical protein
MEKFLPILKAKNFYILLPINITSSQFSQRPALCSKLRKICYFGYYNTYRRTINNDSHGHCWYCFIILLRRAIFGILSPLCIQHSILQNIHGKMKNQPDRNVLTADVTRCLTATTKNTTVYLARHQQYSYKKTL